MIHKGGCHCGAVEVRFDTTRAPKDWNLRACQCSFCSKYGALSTSDPQGSIEFVENLKDSLNRYRFGQRTADFLICRNCGVYVGAMIETPEGRFGIVNVNVLQPRPNDLPAPQPMNYDNEAVDQRRARRQERWSPVRVP